MKQLNYQIQEELLDRIGRTAQHLGITKNALMRIILERAYERTERREDMKHADSNKG